MGWFQPWEMCPPVKNSSINTPGMGKVLKLIIWANWETPYGIWQKRFEEDFGNLKGGILIIGGIPTLGG